MQKENLCACGIFLGELQNTNLLHCSKNFIGKGFGHFKAVPKEIVLKKKYLENHFHFNSIQCYIWCVEDIS